MKRLRKVEKQKRWVRKDQKWEQGPSDKINNSALLSYEHQGRDKLRRTGFLKQPSALYSVAGGYWLLKMR